MEDDVIIHSFNIIFVDSQHHTISSQWKDRKEPEQLGEANQSNSQLGHAQVYTKWEMVYVS